MASMAPASIYELSVPLRAIVAKECALRLRSLEQADEATPDAAREMLESWVRILELSLFSASVLDAAAQLGLRTFGDLVREFRRVDAIVITLSRLDPEKVLAENAAVLAPYRESPPHPDELVAQDLALVVRAIQSLLLHCPTESLEHVARVPEERELAHRCRLAVEGLRGFVARNQHPADAVLSAVGHAHAEGRLSIDEVAAALASGCPTRSCSSKARASAGRWPGRASRRRLGASVFGSFEPTGSPAAAKP